MLSFLPKSKIPRLEFLRLASAIDRRLENGEIDLKQHTLENLDLLARSCGTWQPVLEWLSGEPKHVYTYFIDGQLPFLGEYLDRQTFLLSSGSMKEMGRRACLLDVALNNAENWDHVKPFELSVGGGVMMCDGAGGQQPVVIAMGGSKGYTNPEGYNVSLLVTDVPSPTLRWLCEKIVGGCKPPKLHYRLTRSDARKALRSLPPDDFPEGLVEAFYRDPRQEQTPSSNWEIIDDE